MQAFFLRTLAANVTANLMRNVWSYLVIFCGHFPDGAVHFTEEELEDETRAEWYLRQMLGSANFEGSKLTHLMAGQLGYQIEHHLFPDLPSNRYAEISGKVKDLYRCYEIPYTTGPLRRSVHLTRPRTHPTAASPTPPRRRAPGPPLRARQVVRCGRDDVTAMVQGRLASRRSDSVRGLPVPFANEDDAGNVDHSAVVKKRAIRCALSRICGVCGTSLTWPIAFIGSPYEVADGLFIYPPLHPECAADAVEILGGAGRGVLCHVAAVAQWGTVMTGGFDLVRPTVREAEVLFSPNSPIES